jgi:hypothetical protein
MELFSACLRLSAAARLPAYSFLALRRAIRAGGDYPDAIISTPVDLARKT